MPRPVPRKKEDRQARPLGFDDRVAGLAKRRFNLVPRSGGLSAQGLAQTGTSDQTDLDLTHSRHKVRPRPPGEKGGIVDADFRGR